MTYKKAAIFLSFGIFLACILAGCKSPPPPAPAPAPVKQPVKREAAPTREARPLPPPPPEVPARPITREILELINKSAYETRDLQYFISSAITLEHGKGVQIDIEINRGGEGTIEEINAQEKIIIPKDTGGILIPEAGPLIPGGPRTIRICFDDVDEHTLTFRENPSDNRFYLAFSEDRRYGEFTEYGNETYKVNFSGEIPYIYVRLDERTNDQPRIRELPGRYIAPRETTVSGRAPQPYKPEEPTALPAAATQPAAPQAPANASLSDDPVPPADDEELDLDALLGL